LITLTTRYATEQSAGIREVLNGLSD